MTILTKATFIPILFILLCNATNNNLNDNLIHCIELNTINSVQSGTTTNKNDAIVNMRPTLENFKTQILYKKLESYFIFVYLHSEDLKEFAMASKAFYSRIKPLIQKFAVMQYEKLEDYFKQKFDSLVIKKIGNFERQMGDFDIKQRRKFHNGASEDTKNFEIGFTQEGFYFPFTLRFFHRLDTTYELKFLPYENTQILFIEKYYKLPSNIFEFEKEFTLQVPKEWILMTYKIDVEETKNLGIILEKNQEQIRKFQMCTKFGNVFFLALWFWGAYSFPSNLPTGFVTLFFATFIIFVWQFVYEIVYGNMFERK